jgi:hypothetical protein
MCILAIDNDTLEEHFVSVLEQGGGGLIPEGQLKPGTLHTIAPSANGMLGSIVSNYNLPLVTESYHFLVLVQVPVRKNLYELRLIISKRMLAVLAPQQRSMTMIFIYQCLS